MSDFYLEEPTIVRKKAAIEYIEEHLAMSSNVNGSGGLSSNFNNYEEWLIKLSLIKDVETCPLDKSPGMTYFLIRKNDNRIIGMINIRYKLNEKMLQSGGHIGFGIRPSERQKGYNKINLYLGLKKCLELNLKKVLLTASDDNPASFKTILALGGKLESKIKNSEKEDVMIGRYWIDVEKSLTENFDEYDHQTFSNVNINN